MKQGDQWASALAEMIKRINSENKEAHVRLATVTNLKPFTIVYNGVPFSVDKDIIFVNTLSMSLVDTFKLVSLKYFALA